jgi:hypothetical protein
MNILAFIEEVQHEDFSDESGECKLKIGILPSEQSIKEAERDLETTLPSDYITFIKILGDCNYFGAQFHPIWSLYRFDGSCLEMENFIPFAQDNFGNYFAFNPQNEFSVVKCSHDPFGSYQVAENFSHWALLHLDFIEKIANFQEDLNHPYFIADKKIQENQPKRRWKLWG